MMAVQYELPIEVVGRYMKSAPVDVEALAAELGAKVRYEPLPDNVSGKIECEVAGPCTITVNRSHPKTRQRFTIAHEIAHLVLHRDLIGDGITDNGMYRSGKPQSVEYAANRYAANILMPWELVIEKMKGGIRSASDLARVFGVSPAVAEIRMRELSGFF